MVHAEMRGSCGPSGILALKLTSAESGTVPTLNLEASVSYGQPQGHGQPEGHAS